VKDEWRRIERRRKQLSTVVQVIYWLRSDEEHFLTPYMWGPDHHRFIIRAYYSPGVPMKDTNCKQTEWLVGTVHTTHLLAMFAEYKPSALLKLTAFWDMTPCCLVEVD
jgi:hypothetical protein